MKMKRKKVSILISSCDNFSDCWSPYFHGLKKYWPDCPYDVFLITNYKNVSDHYVKAIRVGEDRGWSANTAMALKHINTPYLIYTHEDFWIKERVNTQIIEDYLSIMEQDIADYIRLYPCPEPYISFSIDDRLGTLSDNAPYRTSLQVALWRKSVFEKLIIENENPWQFEINGTLRSRCYGNRFLSVKRFFDNNRPYHYGINYVCTAINKGRWSKEAKEYAKEEGLSIDFSIRPHEKWWHKTQLYGRAEHVTARIKKILKEISE
jgi:hypothetical protein